MQKVTNGMLEVADGMQKVTDVMQEVWRGMLRRYKPSFLKKGYSATAASLNKSSCIKKVSNKLNVNKYIPYIRVTWQRSKTL
jgi:hypothetical protein